MAGRSSAMPQTVDEIFNDFKGRRSGLVKAFTDDVEKFHSQCDPGRDGIYVIGLPNGSWEVGVAADEIDLSAVPEPVIGLNYARDQLRRKNWLSLVAAHSYSWLIAVAFFFGGGAGFTGDNRSRLFELINSLPTLGQVVRRPDALKNTGGGSTGASTNKKVPASNVRVEARDKEEELDLCGVCKRSDDAIDNFWICCDYCDKWLHGYCVGMDPEKAKHVKLYRCPTCCKKKRRLV